jgi:hypothetical protein
MSSFLDTVLFLHGEAPLDQFAEIRELSQTRAPIVTRLDEFGVISQKFKDSNMYVGRNPRSVDGRIEWATCMSIDVDPVGDDATACINAADRIWEAYGGALIDSGRGRQIWMPLSEPFDVRGREAWFTAICKRWEADVVGRTVGWWESASAPDAQGSGGGYKIDRQHDLARIVRLPGTINLKTGRMASILKTDGRKVDVKSLIDDYANAADTEDSKPLKEAPVPARFWELLSKHPKLTEAWCGTRKDLSDTSGSGNDMSLCGFLRQMRFTAEESLAILKLKPCKSEATDRYCELTVRKAFGGGK